eukprot:COSAG06_NODE_1669_length_8750_cov_35.371736_8_plen_206_part_00
MLCLCASAPLRLARALPAAWGSGKRRRGGGRGRGGGGCPLDALRVFDSTNGRSDTCVCCVSASARCYAFVALSCFYPDGALHHMGDTVAEAAANARHARQLAEQQQKQKQKKKLTPAQQRQQAAAAQRERERVARANGSTVGLPAPPPLRMLPICHLPENAKKTRENVHLSRFSLVELRNLNHPQSIGSSRLSQGSVGKTVFTQS